MNIVTKVLFLGLFTLSACQSGTPKQPTEEEAGFTPTELSEQQKAWDEVMKIHDAIMPKMGALDKAGVDLDEAIQLTKDTARLAILKKARLEVSAADKLMWDWMYALVQLKELRATKTHEEIKTYLSKELSRIKKVKEKIERSMKASSELTKK